MNLLILHGGFQRCATTYLQEEVFFKLKDFTCLSKPQDYFSSKEKNKFEHVRRSLKVKDEIKKLFLLQNDAFPAKFLINKNFPKNNFFYVEKYQEDLLKVIKADENKKFILSHESLFDRINYFADENIFHLGNIISFLKEHFQFKLKIILTVRNQAELLYSIYSYDNWRQKKTFKNFPNFIENFLDKKKEFHEIFDFNKLYLKLKNTFNCEILTLPIEMLAKEEKEYERKLKTFLETDDVHIRSNINVKRLKFNEGNKQIYISREVKFLNLYNFFVPIHKFFLNFKFYKNFLANPLRKLKKNIMTIKSGNKIVINKQMTEKIISSYSSCNRDFEKLIKIDLSKFNYY
tara:strand:- start:2869 stop:3909 length:1041 start_codon:yes stop_codon:yes gene_type:complete